MSNALVSIGSSIRQRLTAPANPNCRYRSSRKLSSNSPESLRRAWGALVASRRNSRHWRGFRHALRQEDGARDARHARLPGADRIQWPGRRDRRGREPRPRAGPDGFPDARDGRGWPRRAPSAPPRRPARVPIVALTGNAMPGDREACVAPGMDDDLAKPFSSTALRTMIDRRTGKPADARIA